MPGADTRGAATRLQPRVDTITEMIVNLEEKERLEIFANVEMRLSNMDMEAKGDGEVSSAACWTCSVRY
eukprot:1086269-Rhodomonas_salina.1